MSDHSPQLRLGVLGVVMVSLFVVLVARMWLLQVVDSDRYAEVSEANRVRVVVEDAPRGRILDASGQVLVDNRTSRVVTIDRAVLGDLTEGATTELLSGLAAELTAFGTPSKVDRLRQRIEDPQYDPVQPVPIAIDVDGEFEVFLAERAEDFPGVAVQRSSVRTYPFGSAAAHMVGYVGRISVEELAVAEQATAAAESGVPTAEVASGGPLATAAITKAYQPDSQVGKTGLERAYEADLRGVPGRTVLEIDSRGRPVRTLESEPPIPGADLQLTVELSLQERAEDQLAAQLESLRGNRISAGAVTRAPAGAVVLVDPRDGSVRAMASYPTYDPDDFVNGISTERYEALVGGEATENPLTNRAISGQYAPGSTFKPLTAYAALVHGLIGPTTSYADGGSYTIAGCTGPACVRTNAGGVALGPVDLARSLTLSSNVYYYWIGDRFWAERAERGDLFQESMRQLGLGSPTGVPLVGEAAGVVPGPEWKQQTYESLPADQRVFGDPVWYPGDEANMSTGQGDVLVTPLQMAMVYATFANGGTLFEPRLVERIIPFGEDPGDPDAGVVIPPVEIRRIPLEPAWLDAIVGGLVGVTADGAGTAAAAFAGWDHQAYPVAAKTGTAEVAGRADSSVFGAWGPAGAPEIVAFTVLEESGFGGEAAAPMVRRILELLAGQAEAVPAGDEATGVGG